MLKRLFQVPEVAAKEERRVLLYASDGLSGKIGCLGKPLFENPVVEGQTIA